MIPELRINENNKMEKKKFYVRLLDRLAEDEGYIDSEISIAFSDNELLIWNENKWTATDIETGCKITNGRTFEDCYTKVLNMMDEIVSRRNSSSFETYKKQFQMILDGQLGRGVVKLEKQYM